MQTLLAGFQFESIMHLISAGKLKQSASKYPDATSPIKAFCKIIQQAHPRHLLQWVEHPQRSVSQWQNLLDVQQVYRDAEAVGSFTVFNIKGNRLVAK